MLKNISRDQWEGIRTSHRMIGFFALAIFVLGFLASLVIEVSITPMISRIILLHIPMLAICGITRMRRIWIYQKKSIESNREALIWWLIILPVGMCFSMICFLLLINQLEHKELEFLHINSSASDWLLFLHVVFGILLIILGRMGLNISRRQNLIN